MTGRATPYRVRDLSEYGTPMCVCGHSRVAHEYADDYTGCMHSKRSCGCTEFRQKWIEVNPEESAV